MRVLERPIQLNKDAECLVVAVELHALQHCYSNDDSYLNAQILVNILPIKTVGATVADCRYERSVDRPLGHAVVKVQEL